jgi:hypothetical protein
MGLAAPTLQEAVVAAVTMAITSMQLVAAAVTRWCRRSQLNFGCTSLVTFEDTTSTQCAPLLLKTFSARFSGTGNRGGLPNGAIVMVTTVVAAAAAAAAVAVETAQRVRADMMEVSNGFRVRFGTTLPNGMVLREGLSR